MRINMTQISQQMDMPVSIHAQCRILLLLLGQWNRLIRYWSLMQQCAVILKYTYSKVQALQALVPGASNKLGD